MCIFWSFSLAVAGLVWPRGGGRRLRRLCHSCHGAAGVVATRALRLHGAHLGGSPWRNDRKNILLLSKFYILMSIYIYIYIYIYRCLNLFSYFCSLYLHICHGQVPWLSFPTFPMLPMGRNKPLRKTERYFSVDCGNCSGLGLKWIPMQFVTRFISNCHSTTRNCVAFCIRFHRLQVLISNQLSSWWSNWWEVASLKCTEDDDLENLTFQFDVQILTSVHLDAFLVWGRFTNLQ